jgi:hypothetical protein
MCNGNMQEDRRDGHFLPVYPYEMETMLEEVLCDNYGGYFLSNLIKWYITHRSL